MKPEEKRMKCNLREIVIGSLLVSTPIPNHLQRFLQLMNTHWLIVLTGRVSAACGRWDEASFIHTLTCHGKGRQFNTCRK